jgi:hypothetical protein
MGEDPGLESEIEIDVAAVIPAHLKGFQEVHVDSVTGSDIYLTIDGEQLTGHFADAVGTNLFFRLNDATEEAELVAACDKVATLEHIFHLPREAFTKPFIPSDALRPPQ